jgi:hypothetical protein
VLHRDPSSGAPKCRVVKEEHEHGRTTEGMMWPALGKKLVVRTTIFEDITAAKRTAQRWARKKQAKIGAGVWMWKTDGSRSDDGRVGAAAVCKQGNQWRSRLVLATGPGNLPAVRVLTGGSVRFGALPGQKPDPRWLGGFVTRTGHKPAVFWPGCTRTAVPFCGSSNFCSN